MGVWLSATRLEKTCHHVLSVRFLRAPTKEVFALLAKS